MSSPSRPATGVAVKLHRFRPKAYPRRPDTDESTIDPGRYLSLPTATSALLIERFRRRRAHQQVIKLRLTIAAPRCSPLHWPNSPAMASRKPYCGLERSP